MKGGLPMKVAVVHDWLVVYSGAERVLEQILQCYPDADLFSMVDFLPREERQFILNKPVKTSYIQKLPFAKRKYRQYLPFMPLAVEQFDLSGYDLVISSSHAVAKGVLTGPEQLHICYCYTPIRYAWDMQHQYLKETGLDKGLKGLLAKALLHRIRNWDYRTAAGVDHFIGISHYIRRRIWKVYRREADVIYPPVEIMDEPTQGQQGDFYLTASRMVPYKKIGLIVQAFASMPEKKLVVIGNGPEKARIAAKKAPNISLLGYQSNAVLREHLQQAKAFVFAAEEDFGIAPLEAQACGTPVIAYGRGGTLETIRGLEHEQPTGVFFQEQSIEAITAAVKRFESEGMRIQPQACRQNAQRFSSQRFRDEFSDYVRKAWKHFEHRKSEGI